MRGIEGSISSDTISLGTLDRWPLSRTTTAHSCKIVAIAMVTALLLTGCTDAPTEKPRTVLIEAPSQISLGEEVHIHWSVKGVPQGDPYRTGVHFGNRSTAEIPEQTLQLWHLPGSTGHPIGDSPGDFSVGFHPLESGTLYYRLHVEKHNGFIWSQEFQLDVMEPASTVALLDTGQLPEAVWANQSTPIKILLPPTGDDVQAVALVASYPDDNVTVGFREGDGSLAYTLQAVFPAPGQALPIHVEATLADGSTVVSPEQEVTVVHEDGALGRMVGGQLASPAGVPFSLYWRVEGEGHGGLGHNDLHWGLISEVDSTDDPEQLPYNVTPQWDAKNQAYRVVLQSDETGFMMTRIHTEVEGVPTWSRIYGVEIYPN